MFAMSSVGARLDIFAPFRLVHVQTGLQETVQNKAAREFLPQPVLRTVGERATNPNQSQKCQHRVAEPQKVHLGNISLTEMGPNVHTDIFRNAPSNILSNF